MTKNSKIKIGKLIRAKRKTIAMTQEQLAEQSGLSVNFISSLERLDKQNISIQKLIAIANALDVSVIDLLKGDQADFSGLPLYAQLLIKRLASMDFCQANQVAKHLLALIDDLKCKS